MSSSPENPITARDLVESGCIHDAHDGVKILGDVRPFLQSSPSSPPIHYRILTILIRLHKPGHLRAQHLHTTIPYRSTTPSCSTPTGRRTAQSPTPRNTLTGLQIRHQSHRSSRRLRLLQVLQPGLVIRLSQGQDGQDVCRTDAQEGHQCVSLPLVLFFLSLL